MQWEEMDSSEAADCGGRTLQTPNTRISQTDLVNSPEIAQQGDWKHRAKQAKNQTFSTLELKDQKLHFPAELPAQEATSSEAGCAVRAGAALRTALLRTAAAHQDRLHCTATRPFSMEQSHHWHQQLIIYKHVTNMNIVGSLFSFWSNYQRRFNVENWHKGMCK